MKRWIIPFFVLLLLTPGATQDASHTLIIIEPSIGEDRINVTQEYTLTTSGLAEFEILTLALSYGGLRVFDDEKELDYELRENIIVGKNIYRKINVVFPHPIIAPYHFTAEYWFITSGTGKPVTGKYLYNIVNLTDTTSVRISVPLTGITATSRASPTPEITRMEDRTIFSFELDKDASVILPYELQEGIDYEDTASRIFSYEDYSFEVTYPRKAEVFTEDIEKFVKVTFPIFLDETATPPEYHHFEISLGKEEDTWAAAEYVGLGRINVLINNTSSYPSEFLTHELIHSYIGDFPRYLEEGMASYFQNEVVIRLAPPLPEGFIPNQESYFQTYERQYGEMTDVTSTRYGLGLTDKQEALIYAKYNKGMYVIYEIDRTCGHETVQQMLQILARERDSSLDYVVNALDKGEDVYAILKTYGFQLVPPHAYSAKLLLTEVEQESWWSLFLCYGSGFRSDLTTAPPEDVPEIMREIENVRDLASQTAALVTGIMAGVVGWGIVTCATKIRSLKKNNPRTVYYLYFVPVIGSFIGFGYLLYELLLIGYKLRWILLGVCGPWILGLLSGVIILVAAFFLLERLIVNSGVVIDIIWGTFFFVLTLMALYFLLLQGVLFGLGYVASLVAVVFLKRQLLARK
ncbi:MAG: hypothetical protein HXS52_11505 [Theionarchaea archaeon]|nr:hypothetical protein [Theionarchaea archaeon]